jgi:hypothetical protein
LLYALYNEGRFSHLATGTLRLYVYLLATFTKTKSLVPLIRTLFSRITKFFVRICWRQYFTSLVLAAALRWTAVCKFLLQQAAAFVAAAPTAIFADAGDAIFRHIDLVHDPFTLLLAVMCLLRKDRSLVSLSHVTRLLHIVSGGAQGLVWGDSCFGTCLKRVIPGFTLREKRAFLNVLLAI